MRAKTSFWIVASCIGLMTQAPAASAASPSADELQKWIADRAVPVRTIDVADEDFSARCAECRESAMADRGGLPGQADGWSSSKPIAPAPAGSLESRLHQLGKPYVFLDFRALDGKPGHPLRKPQSLRIDRYRNDMLTDVTRAFDAVFFLDRMAPATRLGARPPATSP